MQPGSRAISESVQRCEARERLPFSREQNEIRSVSIFINRARMALFSRRRKNFPASLPEAWDPDLKAIPISMLQTPAFPEKHGAPVEIGSVPVSGVVLIDGWHGAC
jgi:hypothetical protein